jgi:hypothetical protein
MLAGLEHLDDRYLKAVGYATKSKRGGLPKMVLIGDIAGDDPTRGPRHLGSRAHRQLAQRRRLHRHQPRSAQEVLAGPQAHRRHQQAHQRLQDQRRRGHPAAADGGVHRRHRAHQHRAVAAPTRSSWPTSWRRSSSSATCPWASSDDANDIPSAELLEDRVGQALALVREVRAPVAGWLARRRPAVPAAAGPHAARQLEDPDPRAAAGDLLGRAFRRSWRSARHPQARAQGPRLGGAAHARRRRQRAHQHPGQQRRLRDAADRARGGETHHGAGPLARRRDLRRARHRHHQAGVPDRRGAAALRRLQAEGRPGRPLQQGQAAAASDPDRAENVGVCRPDQCLHAQLRPDGARVADHAAVRHRRHRRQHQGLPALRQVQAGLRHPRAARQPAVQPAQQDPGHLAAGRGLPVRGADPARRVHQALGGVRGRLRPLHGLPQVRIPAR